MYRSFMLISILFFNGIILIAQSVSDQPLKVGDDLSNYETDHVLNYSKKISFNDFRGKLLILDFWSTGCTSCVESWPKLMELQKEFQGRIQILLINPWQDESVIASLMAKRKKSGIVDLKLPVLYGDRTLLQKFPVTTVPHVVWVDATGKLISITNGDVLNKRNVQNVLNGEADLHQKNDVYYDLNFSKSIFKTDAIINRVIWQSTLAGFIDGVRPGYNVYSDDEYGYTIAATNVGIRELYRYAYSDRMDVDSRILTPIPLNRVELSVKEPDRYVDQVNGEVVYNNQYTYQLVAGRKVSLNDMQLMMRKDLDRYFGASAIVKKVKRKCLVLRSVDSKLYSFTGGAVAIECNDSRFHFNGVTMSYMIKYLEDVTRYYYSPYPFVDETNFLGLIGDLNVEGNIYDYVALGDALRRYGLSLVLEDRDVDVLEVKDSLFFVGGQ